MIETILKVLKENNIMTYLINEISTQSVELFFIKHQLDLTRKKKVIEYKVTLYKDFEYEGAKMRGSAYTTLYPSMTETEMKEVLAHMYNAAGAVRNLYYPLPAGSKEEAVLATSRLSGLSLEQIAQTFTKALFKYDISAEAYVNSAEIFVIQNNIRIVNSEGTDVSYQKYSVTGEFITQCKIPKDVEMYHDFYYEDLEEEAFALKVKEALQTTRDRARASHMAPAGKHQVILSHEHIARLLDYYVEKSGAHMIYPKYSNFEIGKSVQGQSIKKDKLHITLKSTEPYSLEGVKMVDCELIEESVLKKIYGNSRFAYYVHTEPTGIYNTMEVRAGSCSIEDMKKEPYLEIIDFSDFQVDTFTGNFGGEIRLAYYYDGKTRMPVTGGSIAGTIQEVQELLTLSKEIQEIKGYKGPLAVSLKEITVAGQ